MSVLEKWTRLRMWRNLSCHYFAIKGWKEVFGIQTVFFQVAVCHVASNNSCYKKKYLIFNDVKCWMRSVANVMRVLLVVSIDLTNRVITAAKILYENTAWNGVFYFNGVQHFVFCSHVTLTSTGVSEVGLDLHTWPTEFELKTWKHHTEEWNKC
jgi:hypothetical protein